jgi:hypothetical protein
MGVINLPDDLVTFLQAGPKTLVAGHYETVRLIPYEELRVENLELTPNMAPFARDDPHRYDGGYYEVPAVNLILGDPRRSVDFPAWLFLWLPNEQRFASFDLDHGDVIMFACDVRWADIAANPEPFVLASESGGRGPVPTEYLQPWPQYPYILPTEREANGDEPLD